MFTAKRFVLVVIAAMAAIPAIAQVAPVKIQRPITVPMVQPIQTQPSEANFDVAMDPERARALINQLRQEKRDLDAKLTEALGRIDEMTKPGGNLVRAYCASGDVSRNTAGAEENCAASGYACAPVEGTCRRSCNVTTDCAGYHVCDTARHVCVRT